LLGVFALMFLAVLAKLGYMQIFRGQYYRTEAGKRLESFQFPQSQRGRILDRNDVILAEDEACRDLRMDYRFIVGDKKWARRQVRKIRKREGVSSDQAHEIYRQRAQNAWKLARLVAQASGVDLTSRLTRIKRNVERLYRVINRNKDVAQPIREQHMSHTVVAGLDDEMAQRLRATGQRGSWGELLENSVGLSVVASHRRVYPQGDIACHIIGSIGPVFREDALKHNLTPSQADWLKRRMTNYFAGDVIGKSGVEKMAEYKLRPRRGLRRFDSPGQPSQTVRARPGKDVRLTIDIDLQRELTALLKNSGHTGSIVVLDIQTGEILAMVSWPTYDLNTYRRDYTSLVRDRKNRIALPLMHRAVASMYPPGSTVKPITAIAAMSAGKIGPYSQLECTGKNPFARNGKPRCWIHQKKHKWGRHGMLTLRDALKKSCNIYFVRLGQMLGAEQMCRWLEQFGYGSKPGTGLGEERAGVVGTEKYLRRRFNRGYRPSDAWYYAIGQGVMAASPLQVAGATATIARGGVFLSPKICTNAGPRQIIRGQALPAAYTRAIRDGMEAVVHERGGTAYKYWNIVDAETHPPPSVRICGKTGTAQTAPMRIDSDGDGRITGRDEVVKTGDTGWFTGFWPARNPKYAFAVMVEYIHKGGGATAGPIAREVVRICQESGFRRQDSGVRIQE